VPLNTCLISFVGERGVRHSVEVTADTLYEAAAQAVAVFKQSECVDVIGPATELHVAVKQPETSHRVTPSQIRRWCDGVPNGIRCRWRTPAACAANRKTVGGRAGPSEAREWFVPNGNR